MGGVSLLLIPRDLPGVSVRRMKTQGWWMSYTGQIATRACLSLSLSHACA
jgi:alkylation response protein AidB-like acyl-CoA dehydrogenase